MLSGGLACNDRTHCMYTSLIVCGHVPEVMFYDYIVKDIVMVLNLEVLHKQTP